MIGDIIQAGAKLIGGFFDRDNAEKQQAANLAAQREFAQSTIQWKVDDARKAGIHPLYALGASTHSFTPSSVGGSNWAETLGSAGQDISRAVAAGSDRNGRDALVAGKMQQLTLEKASLENDFLRSQIRKIEKETGPALPVLNPTSPAGVPIAADPLKQTQDVAPESARSRFLGIPLMTNPYMMDAESTENRYGNVPENIQGALNWPADAYWTVMHDPRMAWVHKKLWDWRNVRDRFQRYVPRGTFSGRR